MCSVSDCSFHLQSKDSNLATGGERGRRFWSLVVGAVMNEVASATRQQGEASAPTHAVSLSAGEALTESSKTQRPINNQNRTRHCKTGGHATKFVKTTDSHGGMCRKKNVVCSIEKPNCLIINLCTSDKLEEPHHHRRNRLLTSRDPECS